MSLESALHYELVNDSDVSAKVSTRVYAIKPPHGVATKYPNLLLSLQDSQHGSTFDGDDNTRKSTYEITVQAETYGELEDTVEAVEDLLHGNNGNPVFGDLANGRSVDVLSISLQDTRDSMDGPNDASDRGVYVREMDFDISWRKP